LPSSNTENESEKEAPSGKRRKVSPFFSCTGRDGFTPTIATSMREERKRESYSAFLKEARHGRRF